MAGIQNYFLWTTKYKTSKTAIITITTRLIQKATSNAMRSDKPAIIIIKTMMSTIAIKIAKQIVSTTFQKPSTTVSKALFFSVNLHLQILICLPELYLYNLYKSIN